MPLLILDIDNIPTEERALHAGNAHRQERRAGIYQGSPGAIVYHQNALGSVAEGNPELTRGNIMRFVASNEVGAHRFAVSELD